MSLALRAFLKAYRWRRIDPVPEARLAKPLSQCRVALITSGGLVPPGVEPFDQDFRGGDFSHRVIPDSVDVQSLEEHHRSDSFDHSGIESDKNLALPLEPLHDLVAEGFVGSSAPRHLSLMGSITAPGRLLKHTAPKITDILLSDEVDVALMVPV